MNSITKGIFSTFFSKVMVSVLGLVVVIIISRNLGAEGRGIISLMVSLIAFLQLFCDFGGNSAIINLSYEIPQRRLWLSSLVWVFFICLLSYIPLAFFDRVSYIFLVPLAAFLYSFVNINSLLLMGSRKVNQRNLVMVTLPLLLLLGFGLLFFQTSLGISAYPLAMFIALGISSLLSFILLRGQLKPVPGPFVFEKQILQQGAWVQGGHAVQFLNYRINFFIIVLLMNEASLGIYNNVVIIAESIWILGHSMGQMQHMKILNTEDKKSHITLTNKFMFINFIGSLGLMIILILLPREFWVWLFSDDFSEMDTLFIYLAPGVLCFSISNIINHFLHAKNQFKTILQSNIIGLVTGLVVSVLLIPGYGLKGACLSWSCGLLASMLTYIFIYKRYLKTI